MSKFNLESGGVFKRCEDFAHQVRAEHEEADEVDVRQVATAGELLAGLGVRFWITASTGQGCQHNLLPLLSGGTPTSTWKEGSGFIGVWRKNSVFGSESAASIKVKISLCLT